MDYGYFCFKEAPTKDERRNESKSEQKKNPKIPEREREISSNEVRKTKSQVRINLLIKGHLLKFNMFNQILDLNSNCKNQMLILISSASFLFYFCCSLSSEL